MLAIIFTSFTFLPVFFSSKFLAVPWSLCHLIESHRALGQPRKDCPLCENQLDTKQCQASGASWVCSLWQPQLGWPRYRNCFLSILPFPGMTIVALPPLGFENTAWSLQVVQFPLLEAWRHNGKFKAPKNKRVSVAKQKTFTQHCIVRASFPPVCAEQWKNYTLTCLVMDNRHWELMQLSNTVWNAGEFPQLVD